MVFATIWGSPDHSTRWLGAAHTRNWGGKFLGNNLQNPSKSKLIGNKLNGKPFLNRKQINPTCFTEPGIFWSEWITWHAPQSSPFFFLLFSFNISNTARENTLNLPRLSDHSFHLFHTLSLYLTIYFLATSVSNPLSRSLSHNATPSPPEPITFVRPGTHHSRWCRCDYRCGTQARQEARELHLRPMWPTQEGTLLLRQHYHRRQQPHHQHAHARSRFVRRRLCHAPSAGASLSPGALLRRRGRRCPQWVPGG